MDSPFFKNAAAFMKGNPTGAVTVCTGTLCVLMYWYYSTSIRCRLQLSQQQCHQTSVKALQECRSMLARGEDSWGADIRARDAQVRRLELQNVEQTRSVARLDAAMKMCLVQGSY